MESYREHVLMHMYDLWTNWRSDLKRYNITKPKRTLRQALDHVPSGLQKEEWHWLITEIYSKDPHKKASARNSANRANYKKERLHRTGSKPYRQVAWELGANSGNEPSFLQMYRETHKKGGDLATPEIAQKYVAQKVFKSKSRNLVVGCGGGVKAKDLRGPSRSRVELEVELNAAKKENEALVDHVTTVKTENEDLRNRVESVEAEMGKFKDWVSKQLNLTIPPCASMENGSADT